VKIDAGERKQGKRRRGPIITTAASLPIIAREKGGQVVPGNTAIGKNLLKGREDDKSVDIVSKKKGKKSGGGKVAVFLLSSTHAKNRGKERQQIIKDLLGNSRIAFD